MTAQTIISEINAYMHQHGGQNRDWYVGIASDPEQRLFTDHAVNKNPGIWIYRQADSSTIARVVERAYLDAGCDGGPGGGDNGTDVVYAYRKTPNTEP